MNAPHWTKTDLRTLTGFLDSWWTVNRPLDSRRTAELAAKAREMLANTATKTEIVLAGIRAARVTSSSRYRGYCTTIGNQLVRFTEYGKPDATADSATSASCTFRASRRARTT